MTKGLQRLLSVKPCIIFNVWKRRKLLEIQIQQTMSEQYKIKHQMRARNKTHHHILITTAGGKNAILCLDTHLSFYRCFIIVVSKILSLFYKTKWQTIRLQYFQRYFWKVNTSHLYAILHFQIIQRTEMNIIVNFHICQLWNKHVFIHNEIFFF